MKWADILKRRPLKINKPRLPAELLVGSKPREIYEHFRETAYSIELMRIYLNSFIKHVFSEEEPTLPPILPSDATKDNMMVGAAKIAAGNVTHIEGLLDNTYSFIDLIIDYQGFIRELIDKTDEYRFELYDINSELKEGMGIYLPIFETIRDTFVDMGEYLQRFEKTHKQFINKQEQAVRIRRGND